MNGSTWAASRVWEVAGWTMLHYLWVGGVLAALAAGGRRVLRRASPDVRHAYALAALMVMAAAPVVIAWEVSGETPAPERPVGTSVSAGVEAFKPRIGDVFRVPAPSLLPDAPVVARATTPGPAGSGPETVRLWLEAAARVMPGIWLAGAPLTFAYLAMGLVGADRLKRRSRAVRDGELTRLCDRLAVALGVARRVAVGVCDRVSAPVLLGLVRPLILLPPAALTGWSPEQIEMALLHELAHVRRRDNLVNLLQRVIESALFFHPGVWVVSGWVRREREHCCDRIVVTQTGRALDYAEALFGLSEAAGAPFIHGAFMARNHLVDRIRRILSPEDRTMKLSRTTVAFAAALLATPALLLGTYAQQVDRPQQRAADAPEETNPAMGSNEQQVTLQQQAVDAPGKINRADDESTRRILRDAVKALAAGEISPGATLLTTLAEAQARAGDKEGAKETFALAVKEAEGVKQSVVREGKSVSPGLSRAHHLWRIAHFQADTGDREGARATLHRAVEAVDVSPAAQLIGNLKTIAMEQTRLGEREAARATLARAERAYETSTDGVLQFSELVGTRTAAGEIDAAFRAVDEQPNTITGNFNAGYALGAIAEAVEYADQAIARKTLGEVLRRLDALPFADDKASVLIASAIALANLKDFGLALETARKIGVGPTRVDNDQRDGQSYAMCVIARQQRQAGDLEGARETLREAYATTKLIKDARGKSGRLKEVAEVMVMVGDIDWAFFCVEDMESGAKYETLAAIAAAQVRKKDPDAPRTFRRALEDAEYLRTHRPVPGVGQRTFADIIAASDDLWNAQVTKGVVKIRAEMKDYEAARKEASTIKDENWRAWAFGDVANAQAADGDASAALTWSRELTAPRERAAALQAIGRGIRQRQFEESLKSR